MTHSAAPPTRPPEPVSRFEFNLLNVTRFFLGHFPSDRGLQLVRALAQRPPCLSAVAIDLVKDSLSKGCVLFLTKVGGWRNERFLLNATPNLGRIWDRSPLEDRVLRFSPHVVEFLMWATSERIHDTQVNWDAPPDELTPADELFLWLAFDACRADPDLAQVLRKKAAFRANPLCWLAFPGDIADGASPPDFEPCFTGLRAAILECLQTELARRWIRSERAKGRIGDWAAMREQGRAESATLEAFLAAASRANRLDFARFVLNVNATLFRGELQPIFWTGGLQGSGPSRLADRLDTQRTAMAVPRQMATLCSWEEEARAVGYFDDGYAASQMYKQEWEAADGDRIAARARTAVDAIEPLRTNSD